MSTDREALIAGIAAHPADDLRRLVFADWLDDHGEHTRAEFIRLQIDGRRTEDANELRAVHVRAMRLFADHWAEWFGPFLCALDSEREVQESYSFWADGGASNCVIGGPRLTPPQSAFVQRVNVRRGFPHTLTLNLAAQPPKSTIGAVLQCEPFSHLRARLTADPRQWTRFSEPALRHVTELTLVEETVGPPLVGVLGAFHDPHLAGVRVLKMPADTRFGFLPRATVQAFEDSPLAYRVNDLTVELDEAGLITLSRSVWLELERLHVPGNLTALSIRSLIEARFAPTLQVLHLHNSHLDDAAVAALATASRFGKLVELDLSANHIAEAGIRALASARFLPQLEVLDLSANPRFDTEYESPSLRSLSDALNPDCLRSLRLTSLNGLDTVPGFLASRFGDRVTVV